MMNELLSTGIEVMLLGMGIVYSFLAMLVVAIKAMSSVDPGLIAAISAAVQHYRNKYHRFD
jgi:oxaloacetate decarboxylase (Na+ extruding) subunit gamma